ncbi:uncharacterized protein LY89DRAFT_732387 [Mollisia scopiformis]|uniref:Uncharacterized protein n=1 Tax=Mollisia scopiformis TaxID=149040 RepID=A0A194XF75_MOLSC|nr:uncharacterized protein LY89DRAFT_732387 [Mollisia scopiformis]KUJ18845.1 hypothetical protein LY89DRAFT_732387 [Mollisia scopiformis]
MSSKINLNGNDGNVDETSAEHTRATPPARSTSPSLLTHAKIVEECTITLRAVIAGLLIGAMICFANLYFRLQVGLNNSMPLPSALLGYIVFQPISKYLRTPYSPMENALVFYFMPSIAKVPIFGIPAARDWAWAFNPSLAWVGHGMIIRPMVSAHMLLGTVIGWGILSPIAKKKGWAPGPVDQLQDGSQGWIIWTP